VGCAALEDRAASAEERTKRLEGALDRALSAGGDLERGIESAAESIDESRELLGELGTIIRHLQAKR